MPRVTVATCIDAEYNITFASNLNKLCSTEVVVIAAETSDLMEWYPMIEEKYMHLIMYAGDKNYEIFETTHVGSCTICLVKTFNEAVKHALTYEKDVVIIGCETSIRLALVNAHVNSIRIQRDDPCTDCTEVYDYIGKVSVESPLSSSKDDLSKQFAQLEDEKELIISLTNKSEEKYLKLLRKLLKAPTRPNRTSVPVRGVFGKTLRFSLSDVGGRVLPLLTTKKVPFESVFEELKMFIHGDTTNSRLKAKGIKIWDGNSTRAYLDSRGLDYPEGTLGPIYGFSWRKYGADWKDPASTGIDQLKNVIDTLRTNPSDRRMLVTAWNPSILEEMALPPCHYTFQFHCDFTDDKPSALNCLVNMRSADVALGVPFNIASYAMLTHIISLITGISPGTLVLVMGDCHIYENHIEGIQKQLNRIPKRFPHLVFNNTITDIDTVDDLQYEIIGYESDSYIRLHMAV